MYTYMEHLGTVPYVADKALGMRRRVDLYLVRMKIFHHLKILFPYPSYQGNRVLNILLANVYSLPWSKVCWARKCWCPRAGKKGAGWKDKPCGPRSWSKDLGLALWYHLRPEATRWFCSLFLEVGHTKDGYTFLLWSGLERTKSMLEAYQCG